MPAMSSRQPIRREARESSRTRNPAREPGPVKPRPGSGVRPAARPPAGDRRPSGRPPAAPQTSSSRLRERQPVEEPEEVGQEGEAEDLSPRERARRAREALAAMPLWRRQWKGLLALFLISFLVVIGLAFPGMQRSMKLNKLDRAQGDEASIQVANEFLELVGREPLYVDWAIQANRGSGVAQLHMAKELKLLSSTLLVAQREGIDDALRAAALKQTADLWRQVDKDKIDLASSVLQADKLKTWAVQADRSTKQRELAQAAMDLIAVRNLPVNGEPAANVLYQVARDPQADPILVEASARSLAKVLDSSTAGLALELLLSGNRDRILALPEVLTAIASQVKASHVTQIFKLLAEDNEALQQQGMRFLAGAGTRGSLAVDQQEDIGRQILPFMTEAIRLAKPAVFTEALKAVQTLRLIGARERMLELTGEMPAGGEESKLIAQTMAGFVDDTAKMGDPRVRDRGVAIISGAIAGLADAKRRTTCAMILGQVTTKGHVVLRSAVDELIKFGSEDPQCLNAAKAIVGKVFERKNVVDQFQDNVKRWSEYLAKDRPAYERFLANQKWIETNEGFDKVSDGAARLKANRERCFEIKNEVAPWMEEKGPEAGLYPLGIEKPDVKALLDRTQRYLTRINRFGGGGTVDDHSGKTRTAPIPRPATKPDSPANPKSAPPARPGPAESMPDNGAL